MINHLRTSVVISTYNGMAYIKDQLDSIKNQSEQPDEVLIFDDCSSDGTFEFVKQYIIDNSLSTWTARQNEKNKGWALNFWDGIRETSGDIIFTCDQDDYWQRDKILVIRPLVEPSVLTDVISKCKQYGNAVTSMPYNEQIFVVDKENEATTTQYIPRETLRRVSTPQAYKFDLLDRKYHEAFEKEIGIYGSSYTNTMMVELGERLYFAAGSDKNIKLTTKDDLEMFKAYLKADKDSWLK